ncbi:MAG: undecaprenyl-diphosphate phosphatase [Nitrospira sp.]|nr:undecaprenyl-diphosphate phosphatase [Nitrospira sp.]MBX3369422.1 undecaprenyl-diphosphate phosphatase [Nitrospira sp.]MBX7040741.1 undecaprenyl-diphosphate phosphatase [Nitrospira sp.]MCW5795456.1 undecaprenyl-diphosphate phosphatase [Nitrospira sp.]HMU31783.1 undecaprenyl-diphosphate phosphatase [Nitrospira sp.]
MMNWGPELAVILGIIEGLTEFLPVSSTGHLILVGHALGFTGDIASNVEISIQLGSILAIIAYERAKLASLASHALREQQEFRSLIATRGTKSWATTLQESINAQPNLWFVIGLGLAFLPAALVGFVAHKSIKAYLFSPTTVAISLIVGGVIILVVERMQSRVRVKELLQVTPRSALLVGLAQCASLIPGMSRSGSTIVGGLLAGLDRRVATEYSFFLALPTMIIATIYQMLKSQASFSQDDYVALGIGLVVSFVVAWAVIAAFLTFVQRHSLSVFAYYRMVLGVIVLLVVR